MGDTPQTSTFVIRLVHDSAGGVSGVVERVRTGFKQRFEGREALNRLVEEMLAKDDAGGGESQP